MSEQQERQAITAKAEPSDLTIELVILCAVDLSPDRVADAIAELIEASTRDTGTLAG